MHICVCVHKYINERESDMCSVVSGSLQPMDCGPPGSCPWDSPGKNTGVGHHFLLLMHICIIISIYI